MQITSPGATRTQRFSVVLMIELWERFGFYGMQALLLLFLVEKLGFADRTATLLWGAFAALIYAAPAIGGWLGDQVVGSRRAMVGGASCLAVGYLMLSVPAGPWLLYLAMGMIVTGNGLFKPNAANLVRRIYEGDDSRLDAAFTIYYMSVNVGAMLSTLFSPWMRDHFGWHTAFGISGYGLILGLIAYTLLRRRLEGVGSVPDGRPLPLRVAGLVLAGAVAAVIVVMLVLQNTAVARACVWAAGLAILAIWALLYRRSATAERPGLLMAYLLTLEVMLYFVFYQQQSTSLTLFALRNVDPTFRIGGTALFSMSAAQFQAFNPIWVMVASPLLAALYNALGRRGRDLPVAIKFVLGFTLVTASFLVWWLSTGPGAPAHVTPWVMVVGYGLISVGELLISGLALAMIARYTPQRLSAFMMGAMYVAIGIALYIGSAVANLAALPAGLATAAPEETLPLYHGLFWHLFEFGVVVTLFAAVLLPVLQRLDRAHRVANPG